MREIEELKTDLEFKISNMNKILEDELLSLKEFEMEILSKCLKVKSIH